jgi:hypothetical protein
MRRLALNCAGGMKHLAVTWSKLSMMNGCKSETSQKQVFPPVSNVANGGYQSRNKLVA